MSAILSADDLNDFINPGVACIKPVETLPQKQPLGNVYEVTTEDKVAQDAASPAQISLTDCLACSGCVTSAEAVLVSLQSHNEVLNTLDKYPELRPSWITNESKRHINGDTEDGDARLFVATVSPQTRASLAATYNVTERQAGYMINQLLSGPHGLRSGGLHRSGFTWVLDSNAMREVALVCGADEVDEPDLQPFEGQKRPVLTSACPGWVCYAEKTHAHVLPHLSRLKSPQALTGTLLKSVLAKQHGIPPERVWHLAVMPCFDKKLEASRAELTSHAWHGREDDGVRDVDCVITARELLMLAETRNISFPLLPRRPCTREFQPPFPDQQIDAFLSSPARALKRKRESPAATGTSGGYLNHILQTQRSEHPGSIIHVENGRNTDVSDYSVVGPDGTLIFKAARYYGFRNIQNLVRRLKPARASRMPGATRKPGATKKPHGHGVGNGCDYSYVEVMACPGGCTNGGGQIKVGDVATLRQIDSTGVENVSSEQRFLPAQREWLSKVDEAYWSADSDGVAWDEDNDTRLNASIGNGPSADIIDGIDRGKVRRLLKRWVAITGVEMEALIYTTYRAVESDVGKDGGGGGDMERVSALAVAQGGGW